MSIPNGELNFYLISHPKIVQPNVTPEGINSLQNLFYINHLEVCVITSKFHLTDNQKL